MDHNQEQAFYVLRSGSMKMEQSIPFTSPTMPQHQAMLACLEQQQGKRRKANNVTGQEGDFPQRRPKRPLTRSSITASWSSQRDVVASMVTPSPRIMQVASNHQVPMSPITQAISKRRNAPASKSRRAHAKKRTASNKKDKASNSLDTVPNGSLKLHHVPQGVPNLFSSSYAIDFLDVDSVMSGSLDWSAHQSKIDYWYTYGREYYEHLFRIEKEKSTKDKPSWESYALPKTVCTRSMSRRIVNAEKHLESASSTNFFESRRLLSTTSDHSYKDDECGQECENLVWDSSFPQHREVTPVMRTILVQWLMEVGQCYNLSPDTIHLTVKLLDRVLALGLSSFVCPYKKNAQQSCTLGHSGLVGYEISKEQLQCVGSACMLIAAKLEEINPPAASDLASMSSNAYTTQDVLSTELQICLSLKFDLYHTTPIQFMESYLQAACHDEILDKETLKQVSLYLLELSLLEYSFVQFPSSVLAASAVYLAKVMVCKASRKAASKTDLASGDASTKYWDGTLEFYTGYKVSDLMEAIQRLFAVHRRAETAPFHQAVFLRCQQTGFVNGVLCTKVEFKELGFFT